MSASQQPAKMWSGRFREPLDRTFEQWQRSFAFDWRLLPQEVAASKAHAQAIAAAGILTPEELTQTIAGLTRVGERAINWSNRISATSGEVDYETSDQQIGAAIVASAPQAEDIHHFVELELTKEIGALALKLHTGRSRNEQIATDMRLFVRDAIDATTRGLLTWANALLTLAASNATNVMPGYTHLQRAEPILIAHWLLAYVSMLERDLSRFADARTRMNFCPLGSGAIAGATLALDRTIASKALGFTAPTANSMDATSDRDFMLDFAQAASTLGLHISRFAEEITLYATAEFNFVDLPEAFSTGSSAMPQKKNPDLTELARGKSARLLGAATALATLIKGLPLAYNKDLQEGQEQIFDIADTLTGLLSVLPNFIRALKFRTANMNAAAQSGYLNAMAGATYLSNKGVPFRKAHEIIGNAVRMGLEQGKELNDLSLDELRTLSDQFDEGFFAAITLEATINCHNTLGGTATPQVQEALTAAKHRLASLSTVFVSTLSSEGAAMASDPNIRTHKARIQDAQDIYDLVNSLSGDGTLLRRNYAEVCENIRDFTVVSRATPEGESTFLGCGALHLYGPHLAEIRSIVVKPEFRGLGAGDELLEALMLEAEEHKVMSVCLFTRIPTYFEHLGFRVAERDAMPDKIYKDCQTCPRLYACDEVAMVRGPLPKIAVLGPKEVQKPQLVQLQLTGTHR